MRRRSPANEREHQKRGNRNRQQEQQIGERLFQPLRSNPPRPEQNLTEIQSPTRNRNTE